MDDDARAIAEQLWAQVEEITHGNYDAETFRMRGKGWIDIITTGLDAARTRGLLQGTLKGYQAGESDDGKHWRLRAETAEAALSAARTAGFEEGRKQGQVDVLEQREALKRDAAAPRQQEETK